MCDRDCQQAENLKTPVKKASHTLPGGFWYNVAMEARNQRADLKFLKPKVRQLAESLIVGCEREGFEIIISRGLRSIEEQNKFYAQGRTEPGNIITLVKGGFSFHNYGVAFDIRPMVKEGDEEEKKRLYQKAGTIGMKLGLEWGGTWTEFLDMPHFQYRAGYSIDDFRNDKVDWNKFTV